MGPVGRDPSHLFANLGDHLYLVPSNFCDWPSFLRVSTLFNGWQMYIVDRMTKFMLAVAKKTLSGEAPSGQSGDPNALSQTP